TLFKSSKKFNYLYSPHHLLGKISAIFIIFHPFLLSVRFFYRSFQRGISFIFHNHLGVIFGEIALVGTILLIVLSLSKKLPKNFWKFFHKLFLLIFILIICHILFTKNDLLKNISLKIYIYSIMFGSLGYIIYEKIRKKISKNINK
ncbi:MAG: hypothetical protein JXA94_02845, partial [Parachlamydiales bacterium]|nr:hypothetical protein [Parachlamydiales bacterium]